MMSTILVGTVGRETPAEAPLIDAEIQFRQPQPPKADIFDTKTMKLYVSKK